METLVDVPLLPRWKLFPGVDYARMWFSGSPFALGLAVALKLRKRYRAAAARSCPAANTLLPQCVFLITTPLMMAPACHPASRWPQIDVIRRHAGGAHAGVRVDCTCGASSLLFDAPIPGIDFDDAALRRAAHSSERVVAAVHQVVPRTRAVHRSQRHDRLVSARSNFFMSTWGAEHYRQLGHDFMPGGARNPAAARCCW